MPYPIMMLILPPPVPVNFGLIELDIDPLAERYALIDRGTMALVYSGVKPAAGNAEVIVPLYYTTGNNLMALILDDAGSPSYYVAGNDKIQAELVDARVVTTNP